MVSPSSDGTLSSETPLAAAAAVAAAAGTAVGFVTASNLTSSQHQQCSSITSTGLAAGDISAKNAAAVFSEINTGKNNIMYHLCSMYIIIIFPNINIVTFRVMIARKKNNEKKSFGKSYNTINVFFLLLQ